MEILPTGKQFTLFWLNGKREVVIGATVDDAMNRAGYGGGALRALDFFAEGDNHDWEWRDKNWRLVRTKHDD